MKKEKTPEERAAWGKKMQEARAAKRDAKVERHQISEEIPQPKQPDYADLQRQIAELKASSELMQKLLLQSKMQESSDTQISNGRLIGTHTKYNLDPNYYPDPCERLSNEPKLQRFAFKVNYELGFITEPWSYETKDGINTVEPKFRLELFGVKMDDETGEPTNVRYVLGSATFFEDPQSAIVVARENGIDVNQYNEKEFLDEMRYIQMRDWLFEVFYPPKSQSKTQRREMVVNNKIVQYFEMNDENPTALPFGSIKGKL